MSPGKNLKHISCVLVLYTSPCLSSLRKSLKYIRYLQFDKVGRFSRQIRKYVWYCTVGVELFFSIFYNIARMVLFFCSFGRDSKSMTQLLTLSCGIFNCNFSCFMQERLRTIGHDFALCKRGIMNTGSFYISS